MKETPSLVAKVTQSLRLGFLDRETSGVSCSGETWVIPTLCAREVPAQTHDASVYLQRPMEGPSVTVHLSLRYQ